MPQPKAGMERAETAGCGRTGGRFGPQAAGGRRSERTASCTAQRDELRLRACGPGLARGCDERAAWGRKAGCFSCVCRELRLDARTFERQAERIRGVAEGRRPLAKDRETQTETYVIAAAQTQAGAALAKNKDTGRVSGDSLA